MAYMNGPLFIF